MGKKKSKEHGPAYRTPREWCNMEEISRGFLEYFAAAGMGLSQDREGMELAALVAQARAAECAMVMERLAYANGYRPPKEGVKYSYGGE